MSKLKQVCSVAAYDFRWWHKNPRIFITFALAFILCFLLSDKAVKFAAEYGTTMQIVEVFIWTFDDGNSILLSSLLLVLLFADMPFLSAGTPFYLVRIDRKTWITGQALYIISATCIYMVFILASTSFLCMNNSFTGNMWSKTAAMLGYSGAGKNISIPAFVKTMEMSTPYACMGTVFLLMLLYSLLMVFIMLTFNIKMGQLAGVMSVFAFSLSGFLLTPKLLKTMFHIPDNLIYKANVVAGWLSPLNHATYNMHNFGYDMLPRLWHTYLIFIMLILVFYGFALHSIRKYNFKFTGT
ncbi:MAG: hypothetical protein QME45_09615 [Clostridiales bacterium]|nr:hypothetical protein [Clostridiales bacterium]